MDIDTAKIPDYAAHSTARCVYAAVERVRDDPDYRRSYEAWVAAGGYDKYPASDYEDMEAAR